MARRVPILLAYEASILAIIGLRPSRIGAALSPADLRVSRTMLIDEQSSPCARSTRGSSARGELAAGADYLSGALWPRRSSPAA